MSNPYPCSIYLGSRSWKYTGKMYGQNGPPLKECSGIVALPTEAITKNYCTLFGNVSGYSKWLEYKQDTNSCDIDWTVINGINASTIIPIDIKDPVKPIDDYNFVFMSLLILAVFFIVGYKVSK